ncbi:hypothetical protein QBC39DRAFT_334337 [Podospora conica]|nr:hypothetical protein QBC39DRAFT_334337 [Schizothecium conicum]
MSFTINVAAQSTVVGLPSFADGFGQYAASPLPTFEDAANDEDVPTVEVAPPFPPVRSFPDHPDHELYMSCMDLYQAVQDHRDVTGEFRSGTIDSSWEGSLTPSPVSSPALGSSSPLHPPPPPPSTNLLPSLWMSASAPANLQPSTSRPHSFWQTVLPSSTSAPPSVQPSTTLPPPQSYFQTVLNSPSPQRVKREWETPEPGEEDDEPEPKRVKRERESPEPDKKDEEPEPKRRRPPVTAKRTGGLNYLSISGEIKTASSKIWFQYRRAFEDEDEVDGNGHT